MSKYRVDASFEMIGAFWKFGEENNNSFTGTLRSRGGRVRLPAAPTYSANMIADGFRSSMQTMLGQRELRRIPSICGFTSDNLCTLLQSLLLEDGGNLHFPSGRGLSAVSYVPAKSKKACPKRHPEMPLVDRGDVRRNGVASNVLGGER
jgi:hypothetical protein